MHPLLRNALAPLVLALSSLFMLAPNTAAAHDDDAYYSGTANLPAQKKWMSRIPDSTKLSHISMPGTHQSASRFGADPFGVTALVAQNQTLTITQQLNAGIRYLDIRLRHVGDEFHVHHGSIYQKAKLDDVLREVTQFLAANPSEMVFLRVMLGEHDDLNVTLSWKDTFLKYHNAYRSFFATPPSRGGSVVPTLGEVRGKIVWELTIPEIAWTPGSIFNRLQNDWEMYKPSDLHAKWLKVKNALVQADAQGSGWINYLSAAMAGDMLIFPYFVSSGHSSIGTSAPRLPTGLTTPGWSDHFPEFPRVDCFIGICTIAYEGTNTLTKDWINRERPTYVGVVMADFPGKGLIQAVIETNFRSMPLLSESHGVCLDIEYGLAAGQRLLTHPCHGGANQQFVFLGEQVLLGDTALFNHRLATGNERFGMPPPPGLRQLMCLDVANSNALYGARVVAWPCHGGQNQRWRRNANGTIQTLLAGAARCLEVDNTGAVTLQACRPASSSQHFWTPTRFPVQLFVNEATNQCLDIKGGIAKNRPAITWQCSGNVNQRFRFDGERLLVGDMCLDVEKASNVHQARVLSYPCNGGQNQKWRLRPDGLIQSLLPGEARCLDFAAERAGEVRLQGCWPSSPDQRFMRVPL